MTELSDVVIISGARTPVGSFGGAFATVDAHELGAHAVGAALERASVTPAEVDEFIFGCVGQVGPDAFIAKRIALASGADVSCTALAVNRLCSSGLQAIVSGIYELVLGSADVVVAGGAENMTRQPFLDYTARDGYRLADRTLLDGTLSLVTDPWGKYPMGMTAERVADKYHVSREAQDTFAHESQRRAAAAQKAGLMAPEITPVEVRIRRETRLVDTDEHPRPSTTLEKLATLRPAFSKDGSVTAGNSSGINDAGAAMVLMRGTDASARGLRPLGRIVAFAKSGIAPEVMGYAPTQAIGRALESAGIDRGQLDWIELNEAFAAQTVAVVRDAKLDPERVNPLGGAIAWGHPVGATGAILTLRTLLNLRRTGGRFGLVTMCVGGGQGVAAILEAM